MEATSRVKRVVTAKPRAKTETESRSSLGRRTPDSYRNVAILAIIPAIERNVAYMPNASGANNLLVIGTVTTAIP